jgi:glycosyltransferase involved in cell wall biosynthesis
VVGRKVRVAVLTNIIPEYRRDYYLRLFNDGRLDITVYCQSAIPGMNLPSVHRELGNQVVEVPFHGAKREAYGWQALPWLELLRGYDVYFVLGNPRVFSNVLISLLLLLIGRKVVIQGQLHTSGSLRFLENLRLLWWRAFQYIYLYNDHEVLALAERKGFQKKTIVGMNNGLNQELIEAAIKIWPADKLCAWQKAKNLGGKIVVLSCARLEPKNRFNLMVECLPKLIELQPNLLWCVIGDGQERDALHAAAEELGIRNSVCWLGAVYDEKDLAPWFLSAKAFVHPGSIGLSLLHAFGYGLPVVTHDKSEQHMPEYAALEEGKNGYVYELGDAQDLIRSLLRTISESAKLSDCAKQTAVKRFNTRIMAKRFSEMCMKAAGRDTRGEEEACV